MQTIDERIADLRWRELFLDGCDAVLAEAVGDEPRRDAAIGRLWEAGRPRADDQIALVQMLVEMVRRIAVRDDVTPHDVGVALLPLDAENTHAGCLQRRIIEAVRVWPTDPKRGRTLALLDVGRKQARVECVRLAGALVILFDATDVVAMVHGDAVPCHQPYGIVSVVRDLRRLLRRSRLGTAAGGDDPVNALVLDVAGMAEPEASDDDIHFATLQLAWLRDDLERIERDAPMALRNLRRRLKTATDEDYFGLRCETAVAALLSSHGFTYDFDLRGGSPDFVIHGHDAARIECTSRHRVQGGGNLDARILNAVQAKARKGYCSPNTGLVVDITNLQYHSVEATGGQLGGPQLENAVRQALREHRFGFVVLLEMLNDHTQRLVNRVVRIRVDHPDIEEPLRAIADTLWPGRTPAKRVVSYPHTP
jgi:hypothetical protein